MADKPILFSGPMVRALLAGTKTQTRRTFKGIEPIKDGTWHIFNRHGGAYGVLTEDVPAEALDYLRIAAGDRLYVREAWRVKAMHDFIPPREVQWDIPVHFEADGPRTLGFGRFRQAMHMPRWASRLTLTVTDVRVERLQDISEDDAKAEGVESIEAERFDNLDWTVCPKCGGTRLHGALGANLGYMEVDCVECDTHKKRYQHLWNHINGPGAWDANPWVAAYTFTVQNTNIDQLEAV